MSTQSRFERRWLPAIFFLSGISGLIYQVVWMRMLIRVFGITIYATSTVVATFMGGLALGSWLSGRTLASRRPTLRTYAMIEFGIAGSALAATAFMKVLPELYAALYPGSLPQLGEINAAVVPIRFALAGAALLVPTVLMGSTLPVIARWITRSDGEVGGRLATFYGLNTLGAVVGVVFAGFWGIALFGEYGAVGLGVAINVIVGAVALLHPAGARAAEAGQESPAEASAPWNRYLLLAALSGFCAIGYEIIWTRLLILVLGNSVYAFSTMLGTYLVGIALGSLAVRRLADRLPSPAVAFGVLQAAVALLGVASLHVFGALGAQTTADKYLYSPLTHADDFPRIVWMAALVILPITLLLGAIFPVLGRIVTPDFRQVGRSVGRLYAWNTVGGVLGSLATGYLLIPLLGAQGAFLLATGLNFAVAVAVFGFEGRLSQPRVAAGLLATALALGGLGASLGDVFLGVIEGRLQHLWPGGQVLFHQEETPAAITGFHSPAGQDVLLINGVIVSGKGEPGAMMAHVPLLLREAPERALIVCFGVGTTFKAAVDHIGRVDAVELVEGVVRSLPWWEPDAKDYPDRDDVRVFINDGRNYMLLSEDRYDLIVVDAAPPIFSEGTVNLYSLEFLELTKARLTDPGIFMLWVPTPCFEADFWTIARNFDETFENVAIWSLPDIAGVMLMGSRQPIDLDARAVQRRIAERGLADVAPWMTRELFEDGLVMTEQELRTRARAYEPVTDDRPRTEFPRRRFQDGERFWYLPGFVPRPPPGFRAEIVQATAVPTLVQRFESTPEEFGRHLATALSAAHAAATAQGLEIVGAPFARYTVDDGGVLRSEAGVKLGEPGVAHGEVLPSSLPGGRAAVTLHTGPYGGLAATRGQMTAWLAERDYPLSGPMWESYITDPGAQPDPTTWQTRIVAPLER